MSDGRITYDGDARGLMQVVNWREIKLPADVVIQRVRAEAPATKAKLSHIREVTPIALPLTPSPQPPPPLIEFKHVHFQYGDGPEILHDVSFEIHSGDCIALLGPNGAGKTTLVKHAIGLNKPSRGNVILEGRDSKTLSVAQIAHDVTAGVDAATEAAAGEQRLDLLECVYR